MLTDATAKNLDRRRPLINSVQMHGDVPLPSEIEISLTEMCNRACVFCPKSDPTVAPNQPLYMSLSLARSIAAELRDLRYEGTIAFCGFGEPLLHPRLVEIVECFEPFHLEIVTNGDRLTPEHARGLADAGVDYFCVSLYDGPEQVDHFNGVFRIAGLDEGRYVLRDRWYGPEKDYGLVLANRAGTVAVGPEAKPEKPCYYPAYAMVIDWNGDVLLCCMDWHRRVRFGNVGQSSLLDVWASKAMRKRRARLLRDRAGLDPCRGCNVDGCMLGSEHAKAWAGT